MCGIMQDNFGTSWFTDMLDRLSADPTLLEPVPLDRAARVEDEGDLIRRVLDQLTCPRSVPGNSAGS